MTPLHRARTAAFLLAVAGILCRAQAQDTQPPARAGAPTALDAYVAAPDANYGFRHVTTLRGKGCTADLLELTSQSWRSPAEVSRTAWTHWLMVIRPEKVVHSTGLLVISGGNNDRSGPDSLPAAPARIAVESRSVVAVLGQVPNQPLRFAADPEGRNRVEDALLAFSWDRYLQTGDASWPGQLPMAKSAVRAMDAVTTHLAAAGTDVRSYVVTGASKRGWTTWLTAAVDPRVKAIVPVVIDVLNVELSMRHHHDAYGFWAPAIRDYVDMRVTDKLHTAASRALMRIVDPYFYRDRLTMPKYCLNATGDQFFLPDSSQFYFEELRGETFQRYVPNTDHSLRDSDAWDSLYAFYHAILNNVPRPRFSCRVRFDGAIEVRAAARPDRVTLWQAVNPETRDFRLEVTGSTWTPTPLAPTADGVYTARVPAPEKGWAAFFVELVFPSGCRAPFKFTSGVRVVPDRLPFATRRWDALHEVPRKVQDTDPLPGNVFREGERVSIRFPADMPAGVAAWRLCDDAGRTLAQGDMPAGAVRHITPDDPPGIGWYRLEFLDAGGTCTAWTTAAVLARQAAPAPQDSPVCLDVAGAWFARGDERGQKDYAALAAAAGVNWVRDRLRWRDIEPEPGAFAAAETTYDSSARVQHDAGLKTLQVFHDTPPWAAEGASTGRFPRDLRHVYRLCKAMAVRFKGRVQAWEPWNEANCSTFGGHTVDEMCSLQKAAYLGFKAGDPGVTVCMNVMTGVPTALHARLVIENETWPYFDTYNIHTYDWPDGYHDLWAPMRQAACGRPLWVTESDRGMQYASEGPWYELPREGEILKAHFMAQSYASSLFAGAQRHFHFILGHYTEAHNRVQFGLLRLDKTPRPAYAALAAVGRFLAGARCLGRLPPADPPHRHVVAFRAMPDGAPRDVLVAWAGRPSEWSERGQTTAPWKLPGGIAVEAVYDYLGRRLDAAPEQLVSAPIFIVLPEGGAKALRLEPVEAVAFRTGTPSPVVLQVVLPPAREIKIIPWAMEYDYVVDASSAVALPLRAYNLSDRPVSGRLAVEHAPEGWTIEPRAWNVTIDPGAMLNLDAVCRRPPGREGDRTSDTWITLRGDFAEAGRPVLAFRLTAFPGEGYDR